MSEEDDIPGGYSEEDLDGNFSQGPGLLVEGGRKKKVRRKDWDRALGPMTRKEKLSRLTPRYKEIIARHVDGWESKEIAREVGCSVGTVYMIVTDPLAQHIIERVQQARQQEFEFTIATAFKAVRDAMSEKKPMDTRMKGVDRFVKLKNSLKEVERDQNATNVTVNVVNSAREKITKELQDITPDWEEVDG